MDLITRANQLIESGHADELNALLLDCVSSKSVEGLIAVKRLARDMYGAPYDLFIKAPAAYCLLAWHEEGLQALVENALEENTSKNFSLALRTLASLTAGNPPSKITSCIGDSNLFQAVEDAVGDWGNLVASAQHHLNKLVANISDDDDAATFTGHSLMMLSTIDTAAAKQLALALSLRWVSVSPSALRNYEQLISEQASNEPAFQAFFERNPLFLDPMAFNIWAQPDFHGKKEPDFVIQRSDNSYVVVEIEVPSKPLITKGNQLSADATHAITQVLEYRSFLLERFSDASMTFPNFSVPTGLVVIGMEQSLTSEQVSALRRENEIRHGITVVGFDTLAAKAEAISQNMIYGKLSVQSGRLR